MSRVHVTTRIDAPVERVWETVMNPNLFKEWVTIHRSVENISSQPLRRGSTMDQCLHLRGITFHVHWTLVALNAPNHAEWTGDGPARAGARICYELSADGDGATHFEYTNEFTSPGGRLGSAARRVIMGTAPEHEAEKSLVRLKALLEEN